MFGTMARVSSLVVFLNGGWTFPASDSPVETKLLPQRQAEETKKGEKRRPTTLEEFEELAKEGPKPPWLPFGPQHKRVGDDKIEGLVVAVSREFIEIRPLGKKETVKYPPHTLLDTGAVCHWLTECNCYLLDDVRKGDMVIVGVGTVDKDKGAECFYVSIRKRPGGVVPASRKPREVNPYHLDRQAEIDHAEKGTPLPEHLRAKATPTGRVVPPATPPPPPEKKD